MPKSSTDLKRGSQDLHPILRMPWTLGVALVIAFLLFFTMGQAASPPKTLRAERIELVSPDGEIIAVLGGTEEGQGLILIDESGTTQIALQLTATGPTIELYDQAGVKRAALRVKDKGPVFSLYGPSGNERFAVGVTPDPTLALLHSNGSPSTTIGSTLLGSQLSIHDTNGRNRLALGVVAAGALSGPLLSLNDGAGTQRGWFGTVANETRLFLNDPDGKPRVGLTATGDGALINLLDSAEIQRILLGVSARGTAIGLNDSRQNPRAVLAAGGNEQKLDFFDAEGNMIASLP